ncbi:MAG: cytochrome C, partial [Bdellovibrionaceae bacterium]|nr:cytochrome C [Pseudobdellovibrionaceae bacterium]
MSSSLVILVLTALIGVNSLAGEPSTSIERGRYLLRITGCNDCHTPMYGPRNGDVPDKDWLTGVPVGWKGPWGTTYATNLRQRVAQMSEEQWVSYAKSLKSRPPMPYFALNEMQERDL